MVGNLFMKVQYFTISKNAGFVTLLETEKYVTGSGNN